MLKVIVNSTPLIALVKCGQMELLHKMYDEVIIPEAVYNEICAADDIVSQSLKNAQWIEVKKIHNEEEKKIYRTRLHDGEVEVMILAREEHPYAVIIDDLAARNTAEFLGLPLTGTLGVLIKAKREHFLPEVMPVIYQMQKNHIYFSDQLIELVRKKVDE